MIQESWVARCACPPPTSRGALPPEQWGNQRAPEQFQTLLAPLIELFTQILGKLLKTLSVSTPSTPATAPESALPPSPTTEVKGSELPATGISSDDPFGKGFLWKPEAQKEGKEKGKLVVLLPQGVTGDISSVELRSPNGKRKLEGGTFSGVANGEREHWRFSKAGKEYPEGVILKVKFEDGSERSLPVKKPGTRIQR